VTSTGSNLCSVSQTELRITLVKLKIGAIIGLKGKKN